MSSPSLTSLGRYQIVRTLARGAMGVVYEAVDARLGRTVAIKTVLKVHLDDEATAQQFALRFEREAQAAARMSHPNIVTVYDFGEREGELSYIVMEFVRGRELASLFKGGQAFTLAEAARIIGQLLDALAYAHERGVVHRDVKPANVLIDEAGQVKLADFGVARLAEGTLERTMPGTIVGTPNYMAPEQILGQAVGSRADLFAAGVLLYQCLTGVQPYAGGGMFEVQRRILQDEPAPPSTLRPDLPAAIDAVVARALAKRPEDRYDGAASFAAELRRVAAAAAPVPGNGVAVAVDDDATVLLTMPAPGVWDPTLPQPPTSAAGATGGPTRPPLRPGTSPPATSSSRPGTWPSQSGGLRSSPGATSSQPGQLPTANAPAAGGEVTWPSLAAEEAGRATAADAATATPARAPRRTSSTPLLALLALGAAGAAVAWWALRPQDTPAGEDAPAVTATTPAPAPPAVVAAPPAVTMPTPDGTPPPPAVDTTPARVPADTTPPAITPTTPAPAVPELATAPAPAPAPKPSTRAAPAAVPRPAPPRAAAPAPAPAPAPAGRCAELLERLQLGEPLTPEQSNYFQSRCTR